MTVSAETAIRKGDFVKVAAGADFRAGHDGMVVSPPDAEGVLGMVFAYDRYGEAVRNRGIAGTSWHVPSVGAEAWHVDELDLSTLDR